MEREISKPIHDRFPHEFAIIGLKLVLKNNTFNFGNNFGNNHFLKTKGTAMVTKVAQTWTTLTLSFLEYKSNQN